nr:MAG TPA: hypothetical protein [Caudoviricetes sp.]
MSCLFFIVKIINLILVNDLYVNVAQVLESLLSCVYNLQTFDILPLSLPRNEIFEFRDIGNKKGQCKIYICKEWYDDPEIKKAFDGYVMTQTNTKKILQYPEVIDKHPWVEEYLNPSVV